MSRLITKQSKKIVFDEKRKDFIVIRPLSYDEMVGMNEINQENVMLEHYLAEVRKLLDRDPNEKIEKIVNDQIETIKKMEKEKIAKMKEYNDKMVLASIVKIVDDGKKINDHEFYIRNIDNSTYQEILAEILKLNIPSQDKLIFLE